MDVVGSIQRSAAVMGQPFLDVSSFVTVATFSPLFIFLVPYCFEKTHETVEGGMQWFSSMAQPELPHIFNRIRYRKEEIVVMEICQSGT